MNKYELKQASLKLAVGPVRIAAMLAALVTLPVTAQVEWVGGIDEDWFEGGNWNTGELPDGADIVHIDTTNPNQTAVRQAGAQSGQLHVGFKNTGELIIEDGGEVISSGRSRIGSNAGSEGMAAVSGPGSRWTLGERLIVGNFGVGALIIEDGGEVANSSHGHIGSSVGSQGSVTVAGADSSWGIGRTLFIGGAASGNLTVESGGTVSSRSGFVSEGGNVVVADPGSHWNLVNPTTGSSQIFISGELDIENSGVVTVDVARIGYFRGGESPETSDGVVTVIGPDSRWELEELLIAGELDTGTLNIEDGGLVTSGAASIGLEEDVAGHVTVTGENSRWEVATDLLVGVDGTGELTVSAGGRVGVDGSLEFSAGSTWHVQTDDLGSGALIEVGGDVVLDGMVSLIDAGGLGEGIYTLMTYTGSLTDNGMGVAGAPAGLAARIDSGIDGEIRIEILAETVFEDCFEE